MKQQLNHNTATQNKRAISLERIRETAAEYVSRPFLSLATRSRLTPNLLTIIGLLVNIGAAVAIVNHQFILGGLLILFSGLFDIWDGALAHATKQATKFGALLDSTVDRLSEAILLGALLTLYIWQDSNQGIVLVFVTLIGSFLVSYIRARGEGLGIDCQVGLFTRAERLIILALGILLNQVIIALLILVAFTHITVGQRLFHVWQQTKNH